MTDPLQFYPKPQRDVLMALGGDAALVFSHFQYWVLKNRNDQRNIRDGKAWVYDSVVDMQSKYFDWLSVDSIRNILKKLITNGFLISARYNKTFYDHTLWYSLSDAEYSKTDMADEPKTDEQEPKTDVADESKTDVVDKPKDCSENTKCCTSTKIIKQNNNQDSDLVNKPNSGSENTKCCTSTKIIKQNNNQDSDLVFKPNGNEDDLIDFDIPLARPYLRDPLSTCTNNNQDSDFEIFSTPRPMTEKTELPDIPITNGRRMALGSRAIARLKALCPTGLLSEIVTEYVGWLAFDAIYQRSRFETVLRDLTQRIQQAISERKYGYGY